MWSILTNLKKFGIKAWLFDAERKRNRLDIKILKSSYTNWEQNKNVSKARFCSSLTKPLSSWGVPWIHKKNTGIHHK